jgi:hypothetical protein
MKRRFTNTADVIRRHRRALDISQAQLNRILYPETRNGQFISTIERGIAGLPKRHIETVCRTLGIPADEMRMAMVKDYECRLKGRTGWDNV